MSDIKANLRTLLSNDPTFGSLLPEVFADDFDLIQNGVLDSIGIMNFIFLIEENFHFEVDILDLNSKNFRDLNAISRWVQNCIKEI